MPAPRGRHLATRPTPLSPKLTGRGANLLVAGIFVLLAVVELWQPIATGGWFFPGDDGQAWAFTHQSDRPSRPHNSLTGDVYEGIVPFLHYDVGAVQTGHLPTWNPWNGNGQPYLANGQSALFSPFTAIYYVLGLRLALLASALAKLWLLGFFTFLFLRRHGVRLVAAVLGGVLFAYGGYHLLWLQFQDIASVSALLPVALYCAAVALDVGGPGASGHHLRPAPLAGLAAVVAGMGLSGHPETFLFDGMLLAAYVLTVLVVTRPDWQSRARAGQPLAAAVALGVAMAAVQLIPFWQDEGSSARAMTTRATAAHVIPGFPADTLPMVALPDLFGGPQYRYYDDALYRHDEVSNYAEVNGTALGLAGACFVPLGLAPLLRRRRRRDRRRDDRRWLSGLCVGAVLVDGLLLYSTTAGTVWWHIPVVGSAVLNRSQDIFLFGLAGLAALGVDWVLGAEKEQRLRRVGVGGAVAFATGFALCFGGLALRGSLLGRAAGRAGQALVRTHVLTEVLLGVGLAASLVLVALSYRRPVRVAAAALAVWFAFASNGLVMRSFETTVSTSQVYPLTTAIRQFAVTAGDEKTLFTDAVFPWADVNLWYAFDDVGSWDPLDLAWQASLYQRVFGTPSTGEGERLPRCLGGLQLFGVQWVVGGDGVLPDGRSLPQTASADGEPMYAVPESGLLAMVGRAVSAPDGTAERLLSSCKVDPSSAVVLADGSFAPRLTGDVRTVSRGSAAGATASFVGDHSGPTEVIRTASTKPAWLVIRQTWAPGWSAQVDGQPAELQRADVAFDAVRVPAGTHTVTLAYRPAGVTEGIVVSLLALSATIGVTAVLVVAARTGRRRRQRVPASSSS